MREVQWIRIFGRMLAGFVIMMSGRTAHADTKSPNVVVILADDLGWNDIGFHNKEVKSPNIDQLVADGVRFDRHYSYPICSMTRAALLTGMSTSRTGVSNSSGLDLKYHLMSQSFKAAGYQTWMFGKWHLGGPEDYERSGPKYLPFHRGFDHFYGFLHGAIDYVTHFRPDLDKLDWQRNGTYVKEEGFSTDLLADEAVKMLRSRDPGKPVFLYLAFNAVHGPLSPPPGTNLNKREKRRLLLSNVTYMDSAVGRVLKTIDDEGMRSNTLVLFLSDNGGQLSQGASNEPLRGEKGTVFEGGIHTVAGLRWPGVIQPGSVSKQVISVIDWFPTLASASGIKPGNASPFDGKDLWANLRDGKSSPPDGLVIAHGGTAVFHGPWKLTVGSEQKQERPQGEAKKVKNERDQPKAKMNVDAKPMLFRIDEDPSEKTDLAASHPEVVNDLLKRGKAMTDLSPKRKK